MSTRERDWQDRLWEANEAVDWVVGTFFACIWIVITFLIVKLGPEPKILPECGPYADSQNDDSQTTKTKAP